MKWNDLQKVKSNLGEYVSRLADRELLIGEFENRGLGILMCRCLSGADHFRGSLASASALLQLGRYSLIHASCQAAGYCIDIGFNDNNDDDNTSLSACNSSSIEGENVGSFFKSKFSCTPPAAASSMFWS